MTPDTTEEGEYSAALPEGMPVPEAGEIIMTREQLGRSRKPWLKQAKYRVYTTHYGIFSEGWWGARFSGYNQEKALGGVFDYDGVMGSLNSDPNVYLYISGAPEEPAKPSDGPKRRCNIVSLVGSTIVGMLKVQPKNETFRAKLMASLGEMPPKEADTFDKLKDWVEFNFPKSKPEKKDDTLLKFNVTFNATDSGRCRYSRTRMAMSTVELKPKDIEAVLSNLNEDTDIDELMSEIASLVENRASENVFSYDESRVNTEREEPDDSHDENFEYPMSSIRLAVRKHILENMPDLAQRLGIS